MFRPTAIGGWRRWSGRRAADSLLAGHFVRHFGADLADESGPDGPHGSPELSGNTTQLNDGRFGSGVFAGPTYVVSRDGTIVQVIQRDHDQEIPW